MKKDMTKKTVAPESTWSSLDYEEKFDRMEDEFTLGEEDSFFGEEEEMSAEAQAYEEEAFQNQLEPMREEPDYNTEAERFVAAVDPDYINPEFAVEDPDYQSLEENEDGVEDLQTEFAKEAAFEAEEVMPDELDVMEFVSFEEEDADNWSEDGSYEQDTYDEDTSYEESEEYGDLEGYEENDDAGLSLIYKLKNKIQSMGALDWVIAATSLAVVILLIFVGKSTLGHKTIDTSKEIAALAEIGQQMDGIGIVGENGMDLVTSLTIDRLDAAALESKQQLLEQASNGKMAIMLNVTTLDHDLKIKFVNAETNKMVAGYEFMAEVAFPTGTSEIYTDEDKDGMIHVDKLSAGTYVCKIYQNPDLDPDLFVWSSLMVNTAVKDQIEYVKVDVDDEIKTVEEVVEAVEDVVEEETPVESTLQNTVEWVDSSKTAGSTEVTYTEIKLTDIKEPTVASLNKKFMRTENEGSGDGDTSGGDTSGGGTSGGDTSGGDTSGGDTSGGGTSGGDTSGGDTSGGDTSGGDTSGGDTSGGDGNQGGSGTQTPTPTVSISGDTTAVKGDTKIFTASVSNADGYSYKWSVDNASIDGADNGNTCSVKFTASGTAKVKLTLSKDRATSVSAERTVTVSEPAITPTSESLSDATLSVGGTTTIKYTKTLPVEGGSWSVEGCASSDAAVAKVTAMAADGTATITAYKAGETTISLYYKKDNTTYHTVTCKVIVGEMSASLDQTTMTILSGKTGELKVTTSTLPTGATVAVTWASNDTSVATVAAKDGDSKIATVSALSSVKTSKSVVITATVTITKDNTTLYTTGLTATVTVTPAAASDTTSVLYTTKGDVVYTVKNGEYVKAVAADYFNTDLKFYTKKETTTYKYTGWQTIDNNTYYFDKNGNKVTGDQVIMGAQYHFASDGALITSSGSLGIDVSKWNGNINWTAVANSGVSFVIIRCGYRGASTGALVEDSKYKTNIQGATSAGLKVGLYFFSQATTEGEAVEEASMCLSLASGYRVSYPIFIDLESATNGRANGISSDQRTKVALAFCKTISNAGYKAGVYANKTWLNSKMSASSLGSYNIWLAQYAAAPSYAGKYNMWQYTSTGSISGISGDVDLDISYLGY